MPHAREHYIIYTVSGGFLGSVSKKGSFFRYTFGQAKRAMYHPCLAGLAPASHPIKPVGTQRVALDGDSMRLRVKARKDTEGEPVETYMQRLKWTCVGKRQFCSSKKG